MVCPNRLGLLFLVRILSPTPKNPLGENKTQCEDYLSKSYKGDAEEEDDSSSKGTKKIQNQNP